MNITNNTHIDYSILPPNYTWYFLLIAGAALIVYLVYIYIKALLSKGSKEKNEIGA